MKRVLVVDDERHVVDHIVRIIEREQSGDFAVAGTASSGREALEKFSFVQPDIVVLDVRMPGLSGLDTVRELQRRGANPAFVLSTAYERFDIVREALELGITGYVLKPVSQESLVQALKTASTQLDRRSETHGREFDHRERDLQVDGFVAEAFLQGLMLGRGPDAGNTALRTWLGVEKPWGLVAAVTFQNQPEEGREALALTLQYKSRALCGPLIFDRCLIVQFLADPSEAVEAERSLRGVVKSQNLRLGFADPRRLDDLGASWPQALGRLWDRKAVQADPVPLFPGRAFEGEAAIHEALIQGDSQRIRDAFESMLAPFESASSIPVPDRYRIISSLGSALGRLAGRGLLEESAAYSGLDFDDLRDAPDGRTFCLMARSRLPAITGALNRAQRWSGPLSAAIDHIRTHYGQPLTLDSVAEQVGLTPKRLSRYFIEELDQGFSDYLIDLRIEKAKILLALPGATIKQVSQECGYPDPNYFARLFKKVTGTTPSEFSSTQ